MSADVRGWLSGCRGEAVATHHCCDRREVGRPADGRVEDGRYLAEEVGAEKAGGDDRERRRADVAAVVEVVDDAPRDAERLAGADVCRRVQRSRISAARGSETARSRKPRSISASLGGSRLRRVARAADHRASRSPIRAGVPSAASLLIGRENSSRARGEFVVGQQMLDQRLKLLVGNRDHFNRAAEGRSLSSLGRRFRPRQTHREDRRQTHGLSIIAAPKFLDVSLDELMPGTGGASFPLGPLPAQPQRGTAMIAPSAHRKPLRTVTRLG
jgi:hypothetical protein